MKSFLIIVVIFAIYTIHASFPAIENYGNLQAEKIAMLESIK